MNFATLKLSKMLDNVITLYFRVIHNSLNHKHCIGCMEVFWNVPKNYRGGGKLCSSPPQYNEGEEIHLLPLPLVITSHASILFSYFRMFNVSKVINAMKQFWSVYKKVWQFLELHLTQIALNYQLSNTTAVSKKLNFLKLLQTRVSFW